jgi:peptidoglycan/LPS O-acetylase OafA/YrhL
MSAPATSATKDRVKVFDGLRGVAVILVLEHKAQKLVADINFRGIVLTWTRLDLHFRVLERPFEKSL